MKAAPPPTSSLPTYGNKTSSNPLYKVPILGKLFGGNMTAAPSNHTNILSSNVSALIRLGNYAEAMPYLDKALAIDPNYVNALNDKGVALDSSGNYTGAIQYYDKALAIDPNNKNALDNKGIALDNLNNYTQSMMPNLGIQR